MNQTQDPRIRASIERCLREYGPMTIPEIEVALDLTRGKVDTAIRHSRNIRPTTIGVKVHWYFRPDPEDRP